MHFLIRANSKANSPGALPLFLAVLLATLASACGGASDNQDGGADGGASGVVCGAATCDVGDVCCNASCGICTAPGGSCTEMECDADAGADAGSDAGADAGPDPDAGDACGDETCGPTETCCVGCGDERSCTSEATCPVVSCEVTCSATEPCLGDTFCETAEDACGEGTCKPRPSDCPDDCPGVCGCDGGDYCNACQARSGGTDVASTGSCTPPPCEAMDARGEGLCDVTLGFAYDGGRCVGIHCTCVGTDCDSLYGSSEDCEAAYAPCLFTSCGGFIGATCTRDEYCDYPDGAFCGAADGSGVCRPTPSDCTGEPDAAVCACDGTTYDNACLAYMAGYDVSSSGPCSPPPEDCPGGCEAGSTCVNCISSGGWRCLPDGMFCI